MLTEDGLILMLTRLESLAAHKDRACQAERDLERVRDRQASRIASLENDLNRAKRDMQAAEAKIAEWAAYADQLHSLLSKKQRQFADVRPKPLETEIPF
jgi:DNA repair exonuclease SbcCD ATPase subunit